MRIKAEKTKSMALIKTIAAGVKDSSCRATTKEFSGEKKYTAAD